ncbi:ABC transporter ATP-binding protein [Paraglaciecola marina]|uniref:ABC transporter ATP-binding protein n=1 Tax=Paraglaciecola marina TaxID=2500157 RepID=UPI001060A83D|nr:ATP-binding cassette domain-containing protein [Paraglaciecola marina]
MFNIDNLSVSYSQQQILEKINLQVNSRDFITIIGENGCGKSTLLRCIAGLHSEFTGNIQLDNKELGDWSTKALAQKRAFVAQSNQVYFAFLTEDVLGLGRANRAETNQYTTTLICQVAEQVGISHLFGRDVRTLSGGERQRVFIAKALLQLMPDMNDAETQQPFNGKLLLLDEPTSALDFRFQKATMDLMQRFCEQGLAVICVSHDINLVLPYATKTLLLANGRCLAQGPVIDVITEDNLFKCFGVRPRLIPQDNAIPFVTH